MKKKDNDEEDMPDTARMKVDDLIQPEWRQGVVQYW